MADSNSSSLTTGDQKPSVADVLKKARAMIEKSENWFGGTRRPTHIGLERCALMAVIDAQPQAYSTIPADILRMFMGGSIADFNDAHTHAEVLAAFDRAIELALATTPNAHGNHVEQAPAVEAKEP